GCVHVLGVRPRRGPPRPAPTLVPYTTLFRSINYANQMNDAQRSVMYLAAGGVLDRNPGARVAFIESGASWLVALAERMDEVSVAHANFVHPKLSRAPSQIIDDQVWTSFQHDRACITAAAAELPGAKHVMWRTDYPHAE